MYSNLLQYLLGAYINNYGIFFNKDLVEDDFVLKLADERIIPVKGYVYNASIITEHYHERAVIRIFEILPVNCFYFIDFIGIFIKWRKM